VIDTLAPLSLETDTMATFSRNNDLSKVEYRAAKHLNNYIRFQGRSFCITRQGRVCSCVNKIETKDVIAAFRRADRLYVLRPVKGGRYRVVGDTYVDSLMFGKAYEGIDTDEVDYDIELI
jgi:hypothetical protein